MIAKSAGLICILLAASGCGNDSKSGKPKPMTKVEAKPTASFDLSEFKLSGSDCDFQRGFFGWYLATYTPKLTVTSTQCVPYVNQVAEMPDGYFKDKPVMKCPEEGKCHLYEFTVRNEAGATSTYLATLSTDTKNHGVVLGKLREFQPPLAPDQVTDGYMAKLRTIAPDPGFVEVALTYRQALDKASF